MVTVAALNHRALTGQGQYIDFSMAEALSASIPEAILDFQMNDRLKPPMGNQDDWDAPHNVYHCKGSDRWVAIAVTDDEEWKALCGVIGRPEMASEPNLTLADGRRERRNEIDAAISEWTAKHEDYEAMKLLQEAGVPAGPSLDISRVFHERQLREGGYFHQLRTSDGELRDLPALPWRFEGERGPHLAGAPVIGQDNDYVFKELLGLSALDVTSLTEKQIIY